MAGTLSRTPAYLDTAIRPSRAGLGDFDRPRTERLRHPLHAADQGGADIPQDWQPRAVQLLLGHTKMDSTVRYLGVELEDALTIAEAVEP